MGVTKTNLFSETQNDIDEFGLGMDNMLNELLGTDIPASLRVLAPGFSIEKRLGPVIGGIGYYSAGFKITDAQFLGLGQFDNITTNEI